MYICKRKTEVITQNTKIEASDFGGWQCANLGTTVCTVDGYPLDPNGVLFGLDFTKLHPDVIWSEPIHITFTGAGTNKLVLTRLKYTKK